MDSSSCPFVCEIVFFNSYCGSLCTVESHSLTAGEKRESFSPLYLLLFDFVFVVVGGRGVVGVLGVPGSLEFYGLLEVPGTIGVVSIIGVVATRGLICVLRFVDPRGCQELVAFFGGFAAFVFVRGPLFLTPKIPSSGLYSVLTEGLEAWHIIVLMEQSIVGGGGSALRGG